jgi:acyl carrier protein
MRGVTRIGFGRSGNSFQHLVAGWSHDDGTRSWTIGHESTLTLPCPRQPAIYMLRAIGMAFTTPKSPYQRLIIRVNDVEVGRFLLNADFKIECAVPWNVLANASDVVIAFHHPDAVRPCDVSTVNDARWIAVGVDELTLRVAAPHEASTFRAVETASVADPLPSPVVAHPAQFGPKNVPFRPLPSDWLNHPIFVHFMETVARNPDKVAIDDGVQALTFAEALQHASAVSAQISELTAPSACVAICIPDSTWAAIAILACLGASRRFALVDSETTDTSFPALAPDLAIVLAQAPELSSAVRCLVLPVTPETPGRTCRPSTGEPSVTLVRCRHGWVGKSEPAFLLEIARYVETCHFNENDRHLSLAPLSAADGLRDMLAALLTGGTVYLPDSRAPAFDQLAVMRHAPVTVCAGPIPAWLALARQPHARRSFRAMRLIRADAVPLLWSHVAVLRSVLPGDCHILHAYSTVETSTCIQHYVTTPSADAGDIVPAGFVLPDFTLAVVDPTGSVVPDGELGELVVRGRFMQGGINTGQMIRRRHDGAYEFPAGPPVADIVGPQHTADRGCRDPLQAVHMAWRAVLGTAPMDRETFTEAGGDSLKLLEFAVELEHRLRRRLPMSLFALRMWAAELAAAVSSSATVANASSSLPPHELMQRFENLGGQCEFAWAQRHCQAEPYSLFRFGGTRPEGLIAVFESSFDGFADPATLDITVAPDGEYRVREKRFGLNFHTDIKAAQITLEKVQNREAKRLRFLAERMLADLSRGEKIFVYRSRGPAEDEWMLAMHNSLRRHGPNRLVWAVSADGENPPGSVQKITEGLLLGYVDPLAMAEPGQPVLVDSWLQLCAAAYRMLTP